MTTASSGETSSPASLAPPLPTLTFGPGGSFSVICTARIPGTPKSCLDVLLRASDYPSWNRFCRKCTIDAQPDGPVKPGSQSPPDPSVLRLGTKFTFDVHMDPSSPETGASGRPTPLEVSVLEPIHDSSSSGHKGWRVAWRQRNGLLLPAWLLRSERVQELVEVDGTQTEYRTWETFYGVLAPVVRLAVGSQLLGGFDAWVEGLRSKVERERGGSV